MKRNITLKELAKILNVSISTVSKALNDSNEISIPTKNKIKELAQLNHYVPNASARSLKSRKTKKIGVIIPDILSNFFTKALNGIERKATEKGYRVIFSISNDSLKKEEEIIEDLMNNQVDGFIISLARETQSLKKFKHIEEIINRGLPLVLFDRIDDNIACDKVSINEELQSELATLELINSNCKNILFLSGINQTSVNEQRKLGYKSAIKANDLSERILEFDFENIPRKRLKTMAQNKKIDGILAADELSAIIAMRTLIMAGYKVPEEIGIIGYTNGTLGENFIPSLTVVDQQAKLQGELSIETIVDRIEGETLKEPFDYKLNSMIIHRESTKKHSDNYDDNVLLHKYL